MWDRRGIRTMARYEKVYNFNLWELLKILAATRDYSELLNIFRYFLRVTEALIVEAVISQVFFVRCC